MSDVVQRLAKLPLNFQPGDAWEYGPATDVLGRLVEVVSGRTLDQFFSERIFKPLAMTDTSFYLPAPKLPRFAAQYRPGEGNKITLDDAPTAASRFVREPHVYFAGAGGLVSTAADYLRFQQMMLNGGELNGVRLLGRKTVELMTANHIGDLPVWLSGPGVGFGLGYSVVKDVGTAGQPGSVGQVRLGRRLLHVLLGRSGGGGHRHSDDAGETVHAPEHPPGVPGPRQPGHRRRTEEARARHT